MHAGKLIVLTAPFSEMIDHAGVSPAGPAPITVTETAGLPRTELGPGLQYDGLNSLPSGERVSFAARGTVYVLVGFDAARLEQALSCMKQRSTV